jgi:iron complex outermembrane receptor protein
MMIVNAKGFGGSEPRYYYPGLPRNFFMGLQYRF